MSKMILTRPAGGAITGCLALGARFKRVFKKPGKKRVLVVRLDAVGDFILWLDAAKELRAHYPPESCEMTLLGSRAWAELARACGIFDAVWPFDRLRFDKSRAYQLKIISKVAMGLFDIAVQPTYSREYVGDKMVQVSGAAERIGSSGNFSNMTREEKSKRDRWYTKLIPSGDEPLMELARNAEFMRSLGLTNFRAKAPALPGGTLVPVELGLDDYYVLSPGAGWPGRQWPAKNFKELARRIYGETGLTGIILGGESELPIGEAIAKDAEAPFINLVGRTSLGEMAYIVSRARLVVGNETGTIHMAVAVSTPSVCILGGGHYGRFLPYALETKTDRPLPIPVNIGMDCFGCNWKCMHDVPAGEPVPCVSDITVDMAWAVVSTILKGV